MLALSGQHVLQQEALQRVEPLLEDRETRDERERDGRERNEPEQRRERQARRGARKADVPRVRRDAADERDGIGTRRRNREFPSRKRPPVPGSGGGDSIDYRTVAAGSVVSFAQRADDRCERCAARRPRPSTEGACDDLHACRRRPTWKSPFSAAAASGASKPCSTSSPACIRSNRAMPAGAPRTRPTRTCAAGEPVTPKSCGSPSTRRRSRSAICSPCSSRSTTRRRPIARATTSEPSTGR